MLVVAVVIATLLVIVAGFTIGWVGSVLSDGNPLALVFTYLLSGGAGWMIGVTVFKLFGVI